MNLRTKSVGIALSMALATARLGLGAQDHGPGNQAQASPVSQAAQRAELTESILSAKERAMGEPLDPRLRGSLKSRMEALSMEQLAALAKEGEAADIPSVLGSLTSDLVYTPVTPCRAFDSRVSQGGPGPIPANTQRNVVVAGTVGFPAQGGLAGGCGVPVGATSAIINFVTVLPSGPGNIRAWAVADPQPPAPLAAIVNYGSVLGLPAIANGVAVPLCNPAATDCSLGDLRLQADTNSTDILGDVVGYFGAAVGNFVDLTTDQTVGGNKTFSGVVSAPAVVQNGNSVCDASGNCPVTGVVPIANGGTGSATQNFVDLTTAQTVDGSKTFSGAVSAPALVQNGNSVCDASGNCPVTGVVPIANGGTGSATQNFVDLTTAQTVGGNKAFTGNLLLSNSTVSAGNILKGGVAFIHNSGTSNTFIGVNAGNLTMSGGFNTASGVSALLSNTTGVNNTASGVDALRLNTTGVNNTASGVAALQNNTTGSNNTASGVNALRSNTTGTSNTASGSSALRSNTDGFNNTAIGEAALLFNTTGVSNTASGTGALLSNTTGNTNTASGRNALQSNTTGTSNTASGVSALQNNTTGNSNTASGVQALASNTIGGGNIGIGLSAGFNLTTGNNNIDIGNSGVAAESGTIRIGDSAVHTRAFIAGIRGVTTGVANAIAVMIDSSGQLGTVSSSRRFKDDVADMDASSAGLMRLRPVTFHYKSDQNAGGRARQYGLIAEEVAEVYPGLVARSKDGQVETVLYQFLPPMLLNELQKQQRTIEAQAAEITSLKLETARIADLEWSRQAQTAELAALREQVGRIEELERQTARVTALLQSFQPQLPSTVSRVGVSNAAEQPLK